MKVLYWAGPTQERDAATIQWLSRDVPGVDIHESNRSDQILSVCGVTIREAGYHVHSQVGSRAFGSI